MQNAPLPFIPVQEVFYLWQLWVFIFCVHNLKTGRAKFYLYHYINNELTQDVKNITFFSDACADQNCNNTGVLFLMNLVHSGQLKKISHIFPVRGHSFLLCDRDFGTLGRADRIYTPEQYAELIIRSSAKKQFSVKMVTSSDILSFKTWWPMNYKKTSISKESVTYPRAERIVFQVSKFRHFKYQDRNPGHVLAREYVNGLIKHTFPLSLGPPPPLPTKCAFSTEKFQLTKRNLKILQN
ncbi:hypothetical protein C0J52_13536 [Blattella germanica]|nr:hypothetical protein C0J52_13536 [Blattella germanica]